MQQQGSQGFFVFVSVLAFVFVFVGSVRQFRFHQCSVLAPVPPARSCPLVPLFRSLVGSSSLSRFGSLLSCFVTPFPLSSSLQAK